MRAKDMFVHNVLVELCRKIYGLDLGCTVYSSLAPYMYESNN